MSAKGKPSKKKRVLGEIFERCLESGDMAFSGDLLRDVAKKHQFGNQFDAVKIDRKELLPDIMLAQDYYLIQLGDGRYRFVKGIGAGYHAFEPIPDNEKIIWYYRKSLINDVGTSESSSLSVVNNQRILHDFLYEDIVASPKMYNARRAKDSLIYTLNGESIATLKLQLEMDMVCEYMGQITIFEGKNGFPDDFAVYQLFHPYLYFSKIKKEGIPEIKGINCCYMLRGKGKESGLIRLYLYEFDRDDPTSIRLTKCGQYELRRR